MNFNRNAVITDGQRFEINGLNIWEYRWLSTGEKIEVKDPTYGRKYTFTVYEISTDNRVVTFAAGEYSNSIWGIYYLK